MDCAPLNLAHFHERRSDRFLRYYRYDDAIKALETSLLYLQDAYKSVTIPKSIEILNTQKWDFERKLHQIEMRKMQHGINKIKDFTSIKESSPMMTLRPEYSGSAQSVAKAIDKTVQDFDAKFKSTQDSLLDYTAKEANKRDGSFAKMAICVDTTMTKSEPQQRVLQSDDIAQNQEKNNENGESEISLVPLELPAFDFSMFSSSSAPSLASFIGFTETSQK